MITHKTYEAFSGLTLIESVNATQLFQGILEDKGRFIDLDKLTGKSRDEVISVIEQLDSKGLIKIANPNIDWDEVHGLELKAVKLLVELRTYTDPIDNKDQGSFKFAEKTRLESGTDQFRIGFATYRGVVEKLESPEDPLTPFRLSIGRLTMLNPSSETVDRFRHVNQFEFCTKEGAWAHFDAFREKRESAEHGINDQFIIGEAGVFHGFKFDIGKEDFSGFAEIVELGNLELPFPVIQSGEFISESEAYKWWESYLDEHAPAGELPQEFRLGRLENLEFFESENPPASDVVIPEDEEPVFEFNTVVLGITYSIRVFHGERPSIEAICFDDSGNKKVKTANVLLEEVETEKDAVEFASDWLLQ